jgi:hypothetical protein
VLLTTNGYLGLEQGGYQKLLLTDNRARKTAVNEFLALSPVSSSLSRITLESPMIDFKIGHVYDVSVVYAEAPSPMLCHPEHKQPVGSFLVDIPGISER